MALVAVDGFDLYNGVAAPTLTAPSFQTKWTSQGGAGSGYSLVAGRFGGQALRVSASGNAIATRVLSSNYTSGLSVGFAFRINGLPTGTGFNALVSYLWGFQSSSAAWQFGVRPTATGSLEVTRASSQSGATVIGTTANGLIVSGNWYYLEIEADLSTTVGRVTLYLNGAQVLNLTGVNNLNAGAGTDVGLFVYQFTNGSTGMGTGDLDDWYEASTSTRVGEGKVETLRPSADTATKNWTPDTGVVNFSRVNETLADGDTSYVQASTVGTLDLYDLGDLSSTPAAIYGVQVAGFARKTDAGTRSIALSVKSGATSSDGSNFALGSSYSKLERMLTTDPNTSAAWGTTAVNALQSGPKVTV